MRPGSYALQQQPKKADAPDLNAKMKDMGDQAAFIADASVMALTLQGKYKRGANLFWVNRLECFAGHPDEPFGDVEPLLLLLGGSGASRRGLDHSRQGPKLQAA